jgi:hypothetical protein
MSYSKRLVRLLAGVGKCAMPGRSLARYLFLAGIEWLMKKKREREREGEGRGKIYQKRKYQV